MISFIKKNRFVSLALIIISLSLVYVCGSFASSTHFEKIAEYATDIVLNHTENKKYCAVTVEASDESGAIADSDSEFHQLYGVFLQQKVTFASGMNVDKRHVISIGDSISDNLSVLYVGPVGTIEYNGHYKHYVSPIEVMFLDEKNYDFNKYVIYISQSHADKLLDADPNYHRNENNLYSQEDYQSLLKKNIPIFIDGSEYQVLIQNIYYQSNYYYDGLKDIMGDFVISSYYFHQNLRAEQQNIYFMSEFTYQNNFFMDYINKVYSSKKYIVKLNHYNLFGEVNDSYFLSFYYSNEPYRYNWVATFTFFVSGVLLLFSALLVVSQNKTLKKNNSLWLMLNFLALFIPYLLFKAIYSFSSNVYFMSASSGKINIWFIVSFVLVQIIVPLFARKRGIIKRDCDGDYYEISL